MTIEEFSDIISCNIIIKRFANQKNRYIAKFEHGEIKKHKDDGILSGIYGEGNSPKSALCNYANCIKGKLLIVNAGSEYHRKEFNIPETLTI